MRALTIANDIRQRKAGSKELDDQLVKFIF
jgi:hypothetical protein